MVGDYKASLLNAIGNFGIKMPTVFRVRVKMP
jgi:hypothetical protein